MYPSIQNLRAFVTVGNLGLFRVAAEKLGVTESAVSHQIARLEAQLGVTLLERGRNGATLTEIGRVFHARASSGLREIELGLQDIRRSMSEVLTLSVPRTFSSLWLAPNLAEFYEAHPSIELRVFATDRLCDLQREGVDLAIRRSASALSGYEQETFCAESIFPVASKNLAAKVLKMGWRVALETIPSIVNEAHLDEWEQWCAVAGSPPPEPANVRPLGTYDQVQAAVIKGVGIGMARTPLCLEALSDGRLCRVGPRHDCKTHSYKIIWPPDQRMRAPQRALLSWLKQMSPSEP